MEDCMLSCTTIHNSNSKWIKFFNIVIFENYYFMSLLHNVQYRMFRAISGCKRNLRVALKLLLIQCTP